MDLYIIQCLEAAGWYEGRKIDVSYMIEEIDNTGYKTVSPYVFNFLQQFGNLLIEFQTPDNRTSAVRINVEAVQELYVEESLKLSKFTNDEIIPIGYIHYEAAIILISSKSGNFYMLSDVGFFELGNTFIETLETVVYQKDLIRLQ